MDDDKITRINAHLESLSYWSSIYETDASSALVELRDQIHDLQLDLQATAAVLPVPQQETQPEDVALQQSGAGPLCAIPSESGEIDDFDNQKVPRLQQLMQTLSRPIAPEQLNEVLPILKSIPPLIDEFLKKRLVMVNQSQQQQQQPPQPQQQQPQQQQQQPQPQQQQPQPSPQPLQQDLPGRSGMGGQLPPQPGVSGHPRVRVCKHALQELKQMLRDPVNTPEKQKRILHILNNNPPLKAAFIKQRNAFLLRQQSGQSGAGGANAQGASQSQQLQHQRQQQQQQQQQLQQQQQRLHMIAQQQQQQQQGQARQVLQQLKLMLRRPITPEKQHQILHILNSNPSVKAAFIKQRQILAYEQKLKQQALQQLMKVLRSPNTPEQQDQILQIFKKKPYLMADLIKDRENFDFCLRWLVSYSESDLEAGSSSADANQVYPQGLASCKKMNRLAAHLENCKKGTDGNCSACKRYRNFYGHHAILCQVQDNECPIPFCFNIKRKLKELPECKKSLQARLLWQNRYLRLPS